MSNIYRILIVEDDPGIAGAIKTQAEKWNFSVHLAENFADIMSDFAEFQPHIVLLDITLPYYNGYHWCAEIRKTSRVPIIFISSADQSMNIVMAMELGADDFIAKPFDQSVLMAKINALLRRSYDFAEAAPMLSHRGAFLDTQSNSLIFNGENIPLTKNEYRILLCLMENKSTVVSREKLMETLWKTDIFVDENTLNVNVARLRKKLDNIGLTDFITTRFGVGYILH